MAITRELSLRDASHEALPPAPPPLLSGEDPAAYHQLLDAEQAAAPPIEDGEFALVPNGETA